MKRWNLLLLFSSLAILLSAQQELVIHRILYDNLSNPAQIHLQGKLSVGISGGSNFLKNTSRSSAGFDVTYFYKPYDFGFRLKSETNYYQNYKFTRSLASWNTFFRFKKKGRLCLGLDAQMLQSKLEVNNLNYESEADSMFRFTMPSYEQIRENKPIISTSCNIGLLYYDTTGKYFIGLLFNDIIEPTASFYNATGTGTAIRREMKIYGGYCFKISSFLSTTTKLQYRSLNYAKQFSIRQDVIFKAKYWIGYETNLKELNRCYAGFTPQTKWNFSITADFQPNPKAYTGGTNYFKLKIGYVW